MSSRLFRRLTRMLAMASALAVPSYAADGPPYWAYPVNPPDLKPAPDDGTPRTVPGSPVSMTLTQIRDLFTAPVWHPDDHPPMPDSVAFGRKPRVFACGYCHMPHGLGRPENSSLAGLPVEYIIQQVADFRSGERRSSEPDSLPVNFMIVAAKAATDAEVREAAEYFAALELIPWIKVIEADEVPKTHITGWMLAANEPREMEPIGARIIEIPEDLERTELRDTRSPFLAYVPTGSLARGKELVTNGAGHTTPCGVCHGDDLRGLGPIPGLAGRSPSYLFRQLYDMQHGARNGRWMDLMRPVVATLTQEDMIAIAAYAASLEP